jgi:hypothetical protein
MHILIVVCAMVVTGLAPFMSAYTSSDAAFFDTNQSDSADAEDDISSEDIAETGDIRPPQA